MSFGGNVRKAVILFGLKGLFKNLQQVHSSDMYRMGWWIVGHGIRKNSVYILCELFLGRVKVCMQTLFDRSKVHRIGYEGTIAFHFHWLVKDPFTIMDRMGHEFCQDWS